MKTNVQETSLLAFYSLPNLGLMEQKVYEAIQRFPGLTDRELAVKLGYADPGKVRPRRNMLVEKKLVVAVSQRRDVETGKLAWTWRVNI